MHKLVMALVAAAFSLTAIADISFQVKNVESHQRYPWNGKVDIDFEIESSEPTADFKVTVECTDNIGNTNLTVRTVKYNDNGISLTEFVLKPGKHRLTWDADVDAPNVKLPKVSLAVFASVIGVIDTAEYLVIDLSGGSDAASYPVTTMTGAPSGGWTDEYKTTKLVMRHCPKGTDPLGRYTLTQDFYAGVFEVTEKQWCLVMGGSTSRETYPKASVSYNTIRGTSLGANWPSSSAVDTTSFIGKLRNKTGLSALDLPTEAQWEFACRAGTTTTYNTGDSEYSLAGAGWYSGNAGGSTHPVGQKVANSWGLYDMHGNVWEWCLDWDGASLTGNNPVGAASGSYRYTRGGSYSFDADYAPSSYRYYYSMYPSRAYDFLGFRLFRTIP